MNEHILHTKNLSDCVHPCPGGYFSGTQKTLYVAAGTCNQISKRIPGPLLDRMDIHIEVPLVDYEKLSGDRLGESSEVIRTKVEAARNIQQVRFTNLE